MILLRLYFLKVREAETGSKVAEEKAQMLKATLEAAEAAKQHQKSSYQKTLQFEAISPAKVYFKFI